MNKVIITGASGFLGKHLLRELLKRHIEVIAVVHSADRLADVCSAHLHIVEAGLEDYNLLDVRIPTDDYDVFYHFAWAGTSGKEREDASLQLANVKAACAAVGAAKRLGCRKFVNAGSLMEYEAIQCMQTQGIVPDGNYMYRSAKLAAHYMAKTEAAGTGIPFLNLIISNVYGEGELSARFISMTLQKLLLGEALSFTSGAQLYDFIYVDDAVEAFYKAGELGLAYRDYYIGSGQIRPLRAYIEELYRCLPVSRTPVFGVVPYDGVQLSYQEFDTNALSRDTGFACRVSFSDGIKRTYAWMERKYGAELERERVSH